MQAKAAPHRLRLFDWIRYRAPKGLGKGSPITKLVGIDTEAYTTGRVFLICTSNGDVWTPSIWPRCLFTRQYRGTDFGVWNLKYDSGAFLMHLPKRKLNELRKTGRTLHAGIRYRYIPQKMLRLTHNNHTVTFWDVMQFYGGGLHYNCKKYLGWEIQDVANKAHTPASAKRNWLAIVKGCSQSAKATSELARVYLEQLAEIQLRPTALYSMASISQRYFRENAPTIDVDRFWQTGKRTLYFAMEAYHGGKFEVERRGRFEGYLYDLVRAYASVIRDLIDIRDCKVMQDANYHKDATYGFLHCEVYIEGDIPHPLARPMGSLKVYPSGRFTTYMTKREYEYMKRLKVPIRIIDAQWLYATSDLRPYRAVVDRMGELRDKYKATNPVLSNICKGVPNSIYGKWIQLTPEGDNNVRAGGLWNPIYAAITTSEIRLRVCEAQLELGNDCLALHADSIISTKPLPKSWIGSANGQWELKREGEGVVIGNGIYQIADKVAFRGFDLRDGTKWTEVLKKMGSASTFEIPSRRVKSWVQAIAQDKPDEINLFVDKTRKIDLNADCKRVWLAKATGRSLLRGLQDSIPVQIV